MIMITVSGDVLKYMIAKKPIKRRPQQGQLVSKLAQSVCTYTRTVSNQIISKQYDIRVCHSRTVSAGVPSWSWKHTVCQQ